MALTKITRGVIKANENYDTHNINSTGIVTAVSANFTGDVSIGGTLTYQDVTNIDSVGVITARAGVNVTGGNVKIGTTTEGEVTADNLTIADSGHCGVTIRSGTSSEGNIFFSDGTSGDSEYRGMVRYEHSNDAMVFKTAAAERLRVDSSGHVRINTGDLRVGDNTNSNAGSQTISVGSVSSGSGGIGIFANPTNGNSFVQFGDGTSSADQYRGYMNYRHADDSLRFGTAGTDRLHITDAGMVGINMTPGTAGNSTYMLQMYNAGSQCFMSLGQGSGNGPLNGLVMGVSNAAHYITGRENSPMIFATNDTERMRLDTSGRLLLNSGTDVRIELGTTGSTGTNNRNHLRGDGTNMKYNCCAGGGHFFEANGGERMRIDSGGRVNIGDAHLTQTSSFLHVGRTTGGTAAGESIIAATLGNDTTMVSALLTVKNAGNRGAQGAAGGSPLAKFEFNNGTAFEIDKNGYRTLPYQPCAMAYNAQGQHMAGNAVAQFNSTYFNIGNMYNSSNGRMTVPVAGRYLVAYSGLHDYSSQNAVGFDFLINGSNFDGGEGYQARNGTPISTTQLSKTLILNLSANDYVQIHIRQSGTQVHQRYGSFSVCLLT